MYRIFTTREFRSRYARMEKGVRVRIDKEMRRLQEEPMVGRPLGYSFLREKKLKHLRLYYLVYQEEVVVLMVTLSGKKDQQKAIKMIRRELPRYRKLISELARSSRV